MSIPDTFILSYLYAFSRFFAINLNDMILFTISFFFNDYEIRIVLNIIFTNFNEY